MINHLRNAKLVWLLAIVSVFQATPALAAGDTILETVVAVETRIGGTVGMLVQEYGSERRWTYRSEERFPLSSTFKPFACAAVLSRVDMGEESLDRVVTFSESELVSYSPVTETRTGPDGMTLLELCDAAVTLSDNSAGNLILQTLDGPSGFTAYMRSIGDETSRLDRWETALNEAIPGDLRDTTTPHAAATSLGTLLLGDALTLGSRAHLTNWMRNDKVADTLLRSVVPAGWKIADKTGAGGHGARSIIAVMWPPETLPLIIAIYMTENDASFSDRNAVIAEIGAAIVETVSP